MEDLEPLSSLPSPQEDPDASLAAAVALRKLAEQLEFAAVQAASEQGWSWARIAQSLGVTRQAAHKKHARAIRASTNKTKNTKNEKEKEKEKDS